LSVLICADELLNIESNKDGAGSIYSANDDRLAASVQ
jgi:hypothetical protein